MKSILIACLLLISSNALYGQAKGPQGLTSQPNQTDSALTAEIRHVFQSVSTNLLKAAREMPENDYTFKPANAERTFGELIAHIGSVQSTLCANINGHPAKSSSEKESKDILIKNLESSVGECMTVFTELSAENASKMVQTPAGQLTHLAALVYIITHASEEYGQISIYLDLKNKARPTDDNAKAGAAGKAKP